GQPPLSTARRRHHRPAHASPSHTPTTSAMTPSPAAAAPYWLYVGTYTELPNVPGANSQGIYVYRMDPATGALTDAGVAPCGKNPSFVTLHPNGRWLYAVHEVDSFDGQAGGGLSAFALDLAGGVPQL